MHLANEKTHSVLLNGMKNTQRMDKGKGWRHFVCLTLCRVYKLQSVCTHKLLHVRVGVCVRMAVRLRTCWNGNQMKVNE